MKVLQSKKQFGGVESRALLVKLLFPLKVMEELASVNVREDKVELRFGLEAPLKGDNERRGDLCKNQPLV